MPGLSSIFTAFALDYLDLVADLLKELSNHNERVEERKGALVELLKITREDSLAVWDEHFKTILLLLLETLGDKDVRLYLNSHFHLSFAVMCKYTHWELSTFRISLC